MAFLNPIQVTHNNGTIKLQCANNNSISKELSDGVELTIYRDSNNILVGELKNAIESDFDDAPVYAKVLFHYTGISTNAKGDIKGGFSEEDTTVKLDDNNGNHYTDIIIAKKDQFALGIIGVDDIRSLISSPKYNQIYIMEKQRIFLKTTKEEESVNTYLSVKYKKRI
jgi:hypothetical protein